MSLANEYVHDPNKLALDHVHILIIDYDVTRFHSFDLFRWCLLDRTLYYGLTDDMSGFLSCGKTTADHVDYYRLNCTSFNPLNHFKAYKDHPGNTQSFLDSMYQTMYQSQYDKITETDISTRFNGVFSNKQISGLIIKMQNDKHVPEFTRNCPIENMIVESLFDVKRLAGIVIDEMATSIMCGSSDILIRLMLELQRRGYRKPLDIFICKYGYNYEWHSLKGTPVRMLRYTPEFAAMEQKLGYTFNTIDTYSGLTYRNGLLKSEERN